MRAFRDGRQQHGPLAEPRGRHGRPPAAEVLLGRLEKGSGTAARLTYGYRAVVAEMRGETAKKRLELDPVEAEIVRLIYRLCLHGDREGPMGVKAITEHLNAKGFRYRGACSGPARFTGYWTKSTYSGLHYYIRRRAHTDRLNDCAEWIEMSVPAVVEPDVAARFLASSP